MRNNIWNVYLNIMNIIDMTVILQQRMLFKTHYYLSWRETSQICKT
jgi:hypothetical protein